LSEPQPLEDKLHGTALAVSPFGDCEGECRTHTEYETLARELRRQREELLKEFGETEDDLQAMGEERESEWTENAVEERQRYLLTNLDGHERETLGEIRVESKSKTHEGRTRSS